MWLFIGSKPAEPGSNPRHIGVRKTGGEDYNHELGHSGIQSELVPNLGGHLGPLLTKAKSIMPRLLKSLVTIVVLAVPPTFLLRLCHSLAPPKCANSSPWLQQLNITPLISSILTSRQYPYFGSPRDTRPSTKPILPNLTRRPMCMTRLPHWMLIVLDLLRPSKL